jgi:uracil-DNA glycosylase
MPPGASSMANADCGGASASRAENRRVDAPHAREVFLSVARCPNVVRCLESDAPHPCREVVRYQVGTPGITPYDDFQLPEPWVGEITVAPILFVSSNPSIGEDRHAVGSSSDDALWDSHHHAFGGGTREYVLDGIYSSTPEGERLKKVAYWGGVRARTRELIADAVPGRDYALTEVVHCKSRDEVGVVAAADECARRHLGRVLALSPAPVVIVVGRVAREFFLGRGAPAPSGVSEREMGGRPRLVAFVPHPSPGKGGPRRLAARLPEDDLARLRDAAASFRRDLREENQSDRGATY